MRTSARWTLDELVDQVVGALASGYGGQASGRVRDLPDRRAVRYYTTLGLVDRPSGWRGRIALYGERHLLQLAAIKRLQARGLTLAQVQAELTAVDDATLRRLAGLPRGGPDPAADGSPALGGEDEASLSRAQASYPQARRFWSASGETTATAGPTEALDVDVEDEARVPSDLGGGVDVETLRGIGLAPGVILLVEGGSRASGADLAAVRAAAGPLIATVRRLGLGRAAAPRSTGSVEGSREGDDRWTPHSDC
jgi:DNA-binding transcriptional MerR regulator